MTYTYEQLSKMTVTELRNIAHTLQDEQLKGVATLHKEKLLPELCRVLGIEAHAHHVVVGVNKTEIKKKIRELKLKRGAAIAAKDYDELGRVRHEIHNLKRDLKKHTM